MESGFTVSIWPLTMAAASLALALALGLAVALIATGNGHLQQQVANSKQSHLLLDCSCLHLNERNATQWGRLAINASQALGAKNNCLMVFIAGMDDELVAFRLEQLQLRPGVEKKNAFKMSMDPSVSLEDLERRRRRTSSARKQSQTPQPPSHLADSEAMAVINEIFNPTLKLPESSGHYTLPEEMSADDHVAPHELDIAKLAELKEVFSLFDTNCDGLISKEDLRFTYTALGNEPNEQLMEQMMQEAKEPLDYEAFVRLMSRRTQELDPEDVLLEAWSKWDDHGTGKIEERKIYEELTNYGDKMTLNEAKEALSHAPMAKPKSLEEPPMIDYPAFCRMLSGMRKRKGE